MFLGAWVANLEVVDMAHKDNYWEELLCGIYSVHLKSPEANELCRKEKIVGQVVKHAWTDTLLNRIIKWERTNVEPITEELSLCGLLLQQVDIYLIFKLFPKNITL